jgi:uncharacterized phage protein (TIGR01671 family)
MNRNLKFEYGFESVNGTVKKVYHLHEIPNIQQKCDVWNVLPIKYVRQSTGLTDKNGTEIYEGDIVRILYTDWCSKSENDPRTLEQYLIDIANIGEVVFEKDCFCVKTYSKKYDDYNFSSLFAGKHGYVEVVGNVFQNANLLQNVS